MTYYEDLNLTTNQIAGAIALEALHDLKVNNFTFNGFPSITVSDLKNDEFIVCLRCADFQGVAVEFTINKKEAKEAVRKFDKNERVGANLFQKVQNALVELEGCHSRKL